MISDTLDRHRIAVTLLSILTVVAVGFVLKQAQSVVLPLIIAWLLSYILSPAVTFMARHKVPRALAVFLVIMFLFGVCYGGGVFLHGRISALAAAFPKYQESFTELMNVLEKRFNVAYNPLTDVNWGKLIGGYLVTLSGSLFSFFSKLVLVIIFLIFIFAGQPYFKFKLRKALSSEYADHMATMVTSISSQISHYLSVQFLVSAATGSIVWGALTLIGVDFAITWGALAFFLNFIPTVGSILASIPPILIAFIQYYPSVWPGVVTLVAIVSIQLIIGNGISPKIMGDRLNLSPVVVLLSLLFWGWLWGVVGALLAIPITAAIKIVCENFSELRPISIMMGSGKAYRHEFDK